MCSAGRLERKAVEQNSELGGTRLFQKGLQLDVAWLVHMEMLPDLNDIQFFYCSFCPHTNENRASYESWPMVPNGENPNKIRFILP